MVLVREPHAPCGGAGPGCGPRGFGSREIFLQVGLIIAVSSRKRSLGLETAVLVRYKGLQRLDTPRLNPLRLSDAAKPGTRLVQQFPVPTVT